MKSLLICSLVPQIMTGMAIMVLASPALGQDLGWLVHNGVEMKVKAAVAVWRPEKTELRFFLIPYRPTPSEIRGMQEDRWSGLGLTSPDPKKWPGWSPHATYTLAWDKEKGFGDHNRAWILLYAFGIGGENSNVNLNGVPGKYIGVLKGTVEIGEKVELIAKGEGTSGKKTLSWNLRISTKILAFTGK